MISASEAREIIETAHSLKLKNFIEERKTFFNQVDYLIRNSAENQKNHCELFVATSELRYYENYYREIFQQLGYKVSFHGDSKIIISW